MQSATGWLIERRGHAQPDALAGATPYLKLLGDVVGGWMLGKGALAAAARLAAGEGPERYTDADRPGPASSPRQVLAQAPGLTQGVTQGAERPVGGDAGRRWGRRLEPLRRQRGKGYSCSSMYSADETRYSPPSSTLSSFDHAVLDDHRIALRARAHAEARAVQLQADRLGEVAVAVGQHQHVVADALVLAPGLHHEHVVDRDAGDGVDALGLQVGGVLLEAGQVLGRAGGGEGARHGEQGHGLALEQLVGGERPGPSGPKVVKVAAGTVSPTLIVMGSLLAGLAPRHRTAQLAPRQAAARAIRA